MMKLSPVKIICRALADLARLRYFIGFPVVAPIAQQ